MIQALLILILVRPFIASLAFPSLNSAYYASFFGFAFLWTVRRHISRDAIEPIKYPLVLFILAIFISLMFSKNKTAGMEEICNYAAGMFLLIITATLSLADKKRVILCIFTAGIIISVFAIYQYFFGFRNLLSYINSKGISSAFALDYIKRRRPFLPFVTPNALGGYLAMIIPLTLGIKNKAWLILPLFLTLLLTKSLGALLSLSLGLLVFLYLRGDLKKADIIFPAALMVIVLIVRAVMQEPHTQPLFSATMRLSYWQDTLRIIKTHPFVGVGMGNFNLVNSRYAHNSYLQIWAEMGILGIVSILWLVIISIRHGIKNLKNIIYRPAIIALICANAIFLAHNLIDFTFFLPEINLIWWTILGLSF